MNRCRAGHRANCPLEKRGDALSARHEVTPTGLEPLAQTTENTLASDSAGQNAGHLVAGDPAAAAITAAALDAETADLLRRWMGLDADARALVWDLIERLAEGDRAASP